MNFTDSEAARVHRRGSRAPGWLVAVLVAGAVLVALGAGAVGTYNDLVQLDQAVQAQWAQVENAYQRRADLVPSLVETVKGAAGFEQQTLLAVTEARARVAGGAGKPPTPSELERYQRSQDELGAALSRLLVVVEAYPELRATGAFRDLQAQLEGTENRIATERMRFNQAAQDFNTTRNRFPTTLFAALFGARFESKAFFRAKAEAAQPPRVEF